jgi:hypothetical protein
VGLDFDDICVTIRGFMPRPGTVVIRPLPRDRMPSGREGCGAGISGFGVLTAADANGADDGSALPQRDTAGEAYNPPVVTNKRTSTSVTEGWNSQQQGDVDRMTYATASPLWGLRVPTWWRSRPW